MRKKRRTDGLAVPAENDPPHPLVDGERFDRDRSAAPSSRSKLHSYASGSVLREHPAQEKSRLVGS